MLTDEEVYLHFLCALIIASPIDVQSAPKRAENMLKQFREKYPRS